MGVRDIQWATPGAFSRPWGVGSVEMFTSIQRRFRPSRSC